MTQHALFEAIAAGDSRSVEALLAREPGVAAARDASGTSAVLFALYHGKAKIAEILAHAAGALEVHELAALGHADALAGRLDREPDAVSAWSADGFQPLHLAAFFAREAALEALIARGADVNAAARHPAGMKPIHSASASRQTGPVEILLRAGADPDAVQAGGFTALMSASAHGLEGMADALLAAGADVAIRAEDGRAAIDLAREGGHADLAARLDAAG